MKKIISILYLVMIVLSYFAIPVAAETTVAEIPESGQEFVQEYYCYFKHIGNDCYYLVTYSAEFYLYASGSYMYFVQNNNSFKYDGLSIYKYDESSDTFTKYNNGCYVHFDFENGDYACNFDLKNYNASTAECGYDVVFAKNIFDVPTEPDDEFDPAPAWYDLFGWLNKLWESITSLGTTIINGITDGLKSLFVPSEDYWQESVFERLQTSIENKFTFVAGFKNAFEIMSNTEGQTLNYEFEFLGQHYSIDFSWYEPHRITVRSAFSAFFLVVAILRAYKMFSSVFHVGVGDYDGSICIIGKGHNNDW